MEAKCELPLSRASFVWGTIFHFCCLRYFGQGTLTTSNPDVQAAGSWAIPWRRYPTLTTSNPDVQVMGSWARHLGLGTQV